MIKHFKYIGVDISSHNYTCAHTHDIYIYINKERTDHERSSNIRENPGYIFQETSWNNKHLGFVGKITIYKSVVRPVLTLEQRRMKQNRYLDRQGKTCSKQLWGRKEAIQSRTKK